MKKLASWIFVIVIITFVGAFLKPVAFEATAKSSNNQSVKSIQVSASSSIEILDVKFRATHFEIDVAKNIVWDGTNIHFKIDSNDIREPSYKNIGLIWFIVYKQNGEIYAYVDSEVVSIQELNDYTKYNLRSIDIEIPYSMGDTYKDEKLLFYVRHKYDEFYDRFEYDMSTYNKFLLVRPIEAENTLNYSMSFVYAGKDSSLPNPENKYNVYVSDYLYLDSNQEIKLDTSYFSDFIRLSYPAPIKTVSYVAVLRQKNIEILPMAKELKVNTNAISAIIRKEGEPGFWHNTFFLYGSSNPLVLDYELKYLFMQYMSDKTTVQNNQLVLDGELTIETYDNKYEYVYFTADGTDSFDITLNIFKSGELIDQHQFKSKDLLLKQPIPLFGYDKGIYEYNFTTTIGNEKITSFLYEFEVLSPIMQEDFIKDETVDRNTISAQSGNSIIQYNAAALSSTIKQLNINIPGNTLSLLLNYKKPFKIKSGDVSITLPLGVIEQLGENDSKITIKQLDKAVTSSKLEKSSNSYDFTIESNGKVIASFDQYIQIQLPITEYNHLEKIAVYNFNPIKGIYSFVISKTFGDSILFKTKHFSEFVALEGNETFKDIQKHWSKKQVDRLASKSIISGKANNTFDPNGNITRAEFAVLITRLLSLEKNDFEGTFTDVLKNNKGNLPWYALDVEAAARAGIIKGNNGKFKPLDPITREQMTAIIGRALKYANKDAIPKKISDVTFADKKSISKYYIEDVKLAVELKIVKGIQSKNKIYFNPTNYATRAAAVTMLDILLDNLISE